MRRRLRKLWRSGVTHAVLLASACVMLTPLAWMVSTSLKQSGLSLSRGIQWLPYQDVWAHEGQETQVVVLGARVVRPDTGEQVEVGVKSLGDRRRVTEVWLPEGRFEAEVEAFRIRPTTDDETTSEALWAPFGEVHRRLAPQWHNYVEALEAMQFWRLLKNTLAVTYLGTLGTLLSCSFVAYGFARFRFPGRNALFLLLLSTMMLPPVVTMIPVYLVFRELRWIDTLLPLFVPAWFSVNAFAVFLFRQFYMTLPFDLDDAARIDGCNALGIYWHVLLPQTKPVMATVGMFCFTAYWLDFMRPLIYLNSDTKATLSLGLYIFKGAHTTDWHYLMAATLVVAFPCVVLFFLGQRFFVKGVVMSGLKG